MMGIKLIAEIIVLWGLFALYMAVVVHGKGPVGGLFFYPKTVQERVLELGLIDEKTLKRRRNIAYIELVVGILIVFYILIVVVNQADTFWDCAWQFYVLFLGMELFDLFAVDIHWVAHTDWWDIPGTEDLQHYWHDPTPKIKAKATFPLLTIPFAAVIGGLYYLIVTLL